MSSSVIVRERRDAIARRKLRLERSTRGMRWRVNRSKWSRSIVISESDRVERSDLFVRVGHIRPRIQGRRGTIIKTGLILIEIGGEECHASGIDLIVFQSGHIRV